MKKILSVAALAMMVGCGYSESKYEDESLEAVCDWLVECFQLFDTVDTCISESETVELDDCWEYDGGNAKDCVDGLQELTCDDTEVPAVCADVYSDEDCEETGL
jgi:hypothetical protein